MAAPEFRLGVSAEEASALFQVDSTTRGALIPRMTTTQRDAISSPATGLLIYNTTTSALNIYIGGWVSVVGSGGSAPASATYITQTANSSLSAEQALSSLATGLVQVTTTTGVLSAVDKTITTPGTTGNQTINKPAGRVNIAALGTTITVTNSLVTANSIILAVAATADASARVTNVVAASGSFVINTVATTAETAFNWAIIA